MKRLGVVVALVLTFAAFPQPTRATDCPIWADCPWYIDLGCSCEGFYCGDRFICGIPL